jgi:hypothetical protein
MGIEDVSIQGSGYDRSIAIGELIDQRLGMAINSFCNVKMENGTPIIEDADGISAEHIALITEEATRTGESGPYFINADGDGAASALQVKGIMTKGYDDMKTESALTMSNAATEAKKKANVSTQRKMWGG